MSSNPVWRERYEGGSLQAERPVFADLAREIEVQLARTKRAPASDIQRPLHAKSILGVTNAGRALPRIPQDVQVGFLKPGSEYRTTVRLSNAKPLPDVVVSQRVASVFKVINKLVDWHKLDRRSSSRSSTDAYP
jgi:hypothetical protein